MQTLQEQYNQIKQGKGNKPHFLKQARHLFPDYINQYNNYEDTVNILKSKKFQNKKLTLKIFKILRKFLMKLIKKLKKCWIKK